MLRIIVSAAFALLVSTLPATGQDCSAVLQGEVFAHKEVWESTYGRLALAAELSTMSYSEAQSKFGASATLPIDRIPVGGSFTSDDFNRWKQEVRKKLNVDQVRHHQRSILSSGDSGILSAWASCINSRGGLLLIVAPQGPDAAVLRMRFAPYPGQTEKQRVEEAIVTGATVQGNGHYLQEGTLLRPNVERVITLKRIHDEPLIVTVNTQLDETGVSPARLPQINLALKESDSLRNGIASRGLDIVKESTVDARWMDIVRGDQGNAELTVASKF